MDREWTERWTKRWTKTTHSNKLPAPKTGGTQKLMVFKFKIKEVLYLGSGNRKDSPIKHQDLKILRKIEEFSLEDRLTRYNSMQFKKYFED